MRSAQERARQMQANIRALNARLHSQNSNRGGRRSGTNRRGRGEGGIYEVDDDGVVTGIPWFLITEAQEKENV